MAKEPKTRDWEVVNADGAGRVERMPVPGGWLYAVTRQGGGPDAPPGVAVTFVPRPDRGGPGPGRGDPDAP
jgi:hypothetical protein